MKTEILLRLCSEGNYLPQVKSASLVIKQWNYVLFQKLLFYHNPWSGQYIQEPITYIFSVLLFLSNPTCKVIWRYPEQPAAILIRAKLLASSKRSFSWRSARKTGVLLLFVFSLDGFSRCPPYNPPPRGGTPLYRLYRYLPRNRVWFLRFSVLK